MLSLLTVSEKLVLLATDVDTLIKGEKDAATLGTLVLKLVQSMPKTEIDKLEVTI